jgi:hypothetical protein
MPTEVARSALSTHWFDRYARFGYIAKGVIWGTVGVLAVRVAFGEWAEQADFYGAFAEIGEQPLNAAFLILLSLALFGYAGWRVLQAVADVEGEGSDAAGYLKRSLYLLVGLTYGFFAIYAVGIMAGWSTQDDEIQDWTAAVMGWPLGEWLVGAAGALVLVAGFGELYVAVSRRFEVELGADHLGRLERAWLLFSGFYGHTARGVVYSAAGFFAIRAAVEFDPEEARGLADTFRELAEQPYGDLIVGFIAFGFIAFGMYCLMLAFHRHIPNEGVFRGRGEGGERGAGGSGGAQGNDRSHSPASTPERE